MVPYGHVRKEVRETAMVSKVTWRDFFGVARCHPESASVHLETCRKSGQWMLGAMQDVLAVRLPHALLINRR